MSERAPKAIRTAITPTRAEDYPEWYQSVIKAADLAEQSPVRGCMVIKPWGYGIWERIQRLMDDRIKATGHENAYFPLFIPLSFLEKEAAHVEGFAKECAVVTHHRLEEHEGKLVPAAPLEEPLIVRPTSETIIGESFSRWIQSYRDLPLLVNQWANVVRWELRPRLFLRTTEFLWQEGHTCHATSDDAMSETMMILKLYQDFVEKELALPVIPGEKSPRERFPGAERTYSIEAMMQDRKALQAGTSHYLGQNFATASNIRFQDQKGQVQYAYTTSWGLSSRTIGALVMTHSDDDGLRVPPQVAPKQVVLIPVLKQAETTEQVLAFAQALGRDLEKLGIRVQVDRRDISAADKKWQWIKKGIPVRVEIGPREIAAGSVVVSRRDTVGHAGATVTRDAFLASVESILEEMQTGYYNQAREYLVKYTVDSIQDFSQLTEFFTPKNPDKPEIHGGFVRTRWCGNPECEDRFADLTVTIRCIPFDQSGKEGRCVVCGKAATTEVILAKAY